ncbi:unnamed protein product [Rhizophagus irregularis]|nr:unnamed protein product [Rhizophagus irregularis]
MKYRILMKPCEEIAHSHYSKDIERIEKDIVKRKRFKSTNIAPLQQSNDVSDGGEESYFDAIDQNVITDQKTMPSTSTLQIKPSSSSHIGTATRNLKKLVLSMMISAKDYRYDL